MDRLEGAGEGDPFRSNWRLSLAVMLLCFRGMGEMISDCSPSDLVTVQLSDRRVRVSLGGAEWE